jgi:hypothetical protein
MDSKNLVRLSNVIPKLMKIKRLKREFDDYTACIDYMYDVLECFTYEYEEEEILQHQKVKSFITDYNIEDASYSDLVDIFKLLTNERDELGNQIKKIREGE